MCVQYIGDVQYIEGCSVHRGDTMGTSKGYHEYIEGYHEYIGGISWVNRGFQYKLKGFITLLPHMYDDILRCTHDIPLMYSWYSLNVLNIPRCTEHRPMYSWYPLMYWTPLYRVIIHVLSEVMKRKTVELNCFVIILRYQRTVSFVIGTILSVYACCCCCWIFVILR